MGLIIVGYIVLGILVNLLVCCVHQNIDYLTECKYIWYTPKDVYETTKLNWFGAICTHLIMYAISPVWYTLKLIWVLFHIGRN